MPQTHYENSNAQQETTPEAL